MDHAQTFKQWLIEEGKANTTIQSYVGDIQSYEQFLEDKMAEKNCCFPGLRLSGTNNTY